MKTRRLSLSFLTGLLGVACTFGLTGCSANLGDLSNTSTQTAMYIQGQVHGGQQPISGAHVYMYAASTAAYGGQGIAPTSGATGNASISLLTAATGNTDSKGIHYVITDVGGNFDINGAFACTPNTQVYLYSAGGNPQLGGEGVTGTPNLAATLLAVVGDCASATPSAAFPKATFVAMNEVSTVAAAYALAGFATDPLHIGAPSAVTGHALSGTGLANAFNTALNIVNQASGLPYSTLPLNSNAAVPGPAINTVADILASCVNSSGAGSSGCGTLFANTTYGTAPTDTATAAINIAQHPGSNVPALFKLATATSPFQSTLSSANDFCLGIYYGGNGLGVIEPFGIAIDGAGNAWLPNIEANSVVELSSAGKILSGANGYNGGDLSSPMNIAIDASDNVWVTNSTSNSVTKFSNAGKASNTSGYTGGGLNSPEGIAIDGPGDAWVVNLGANSVTSLSSIGAAISGTKGYTGGGLNEPEFIAIDGSGNAWAPNPGNNSVTKLSNAGKASNANGYTGGGLNEPQAIAIDGSGNVWVANTAGNSVTKFSNAGNASNTSGYTGGGLDGPIGIAIDGAGNIWVTNGPTNSVTELSNAGAAITGTSGYTGGGLNEPYGIAIDGSGNAWVSNHANGAEGSMTEMIGVGTPVMTPIAAGLPTTTTADGTSNLGTRP